MNNQRGEIITGVMVVMMVGMMIFGIGFMHGGHCDHKEHVKSDQHTDSETDQHHTMHHSDAEKSQQSDVEKMK